TLQQSLDRTRAELEEERTALARLRQLGESGHQRVTELEAEVVRARDEHEVLQAAHRELGKVVEQERAAHSSLVGELERERAARADTDARLQETLSALDAERKRFDDATAALRRERDEALSQLQALGPEQAEVQTARSRLLDELAREREQ